MEQVFQDLDGKHEFFDQTHPVVNLISSDALSQATQESSDESNESDASSHTLQESKERNESDYGETSEESSESNETDCEASDNSDDGSYTENDDDDNWSDENYPLEHVQHEDRHSEQPEEDGYSFQGIFLCYPLSTTGKLHLENGNQIIMPQSVLLELLDLEIEFPVLFKIRKNQLHGLFSHCGVSEFTAEEGKVYLPKWMMDNLELEEGDFVKIKNVDLEKGTCIKIQPHSTDFLSISNPKAALEQSLTNNFFCLTTGDTIKIDYGGKSFYVNIVETKPSYAINIINTDCEVDFDLPLDYKEPEKPSQPVTTGVTFAPFTGMARRLNETCPVESDLSSTQPRTDLSVGEGIYKQPVKEKMEPEMKPKFHFTGVARRPKEACPIEADLSVGNSMSKGITKGKIETDSSKKELFEPFTGRKYSLRS